MHYIEGNSIDLPELAKEKFLDTCTARYFAVHGQSPKKAEFVLCKK